MFHKATDMRFLDGTALEVRFQDGKVNRYDMAMLFGKYPQLKALEDRKLFLSGRLMGAYGIMWNDDLDIETETIYEDGELFAKNSRRQIAQRRQLSWQREQPVGSHRNNWLPLRESISRTFPRSNAAWPILLFPH